MLQLYKSLVRPKLEYCTGRNGGLIFVKIELLEKVYREAL